MQESARVPIEWIAQLLVNQPKVVLGKQEVDAILPHEGWWHLIDTVTFFVDTVTSVNKAIGELFFIGEICRGHVIDGVLLAPGCIWYDMAAQFFGIMISREPKVLARLGKDNKVASKGYGASNFRGPAFPDDYLIIEGPPTVAYKERLGLFTITGGPFSIRRRGEKKPIVEIESVTLMPASFKDLKRSNA
ncbi:MAG: hypothetical protein NTW11_03170 [Candidatus Staskawiczbacteria bacterium]|nr:hypothetical protein [Candidatus Staskawiczbacteria bacterium]